MEDALLDSAPPLCLLTNLAVFKSVVSVQLVPLYNSVTALSGCPPKANADVYVPPAPAAGLPVFKSATSVQLLPFQDSV